VGVACRFADLLGGLTDDLDELGDGQPQDLVM
jgi:hypothetical protein